LTAQEVTEEAASQALRGCEIVRSIRKLGRGRRKKRTEVLASLIEEAGALVLSGMAPQEVRQSLNSMTTPDGTGKPRSDPASDHQSDCNAFEAMVDQEPRRVTLSTGLDDDTIEIAIADIDLEFPAIIPAGC
jgi:hypothetical protein